MNYLELKLSKMAMIAVAKAILDSAGMRIEMPEQRSHSETENLIEYVLNYSNSVTDRLPTKIKAGIEETIVCLVEEINSWAEYLSHFRQKSLKSSSSDFNFAKVTFFTPFGAIDESQIIKKYWLPNRDKFEKSLFLDFACMFLQKKFIFELRHEIIDYLMELSSDRHRPPPGDYKQFESKNALQGLKNEEVIAFVLIFWVTVHFHHTRFSSIEISEEPNPFSLTPNKIKSPSLELCRSIFLMTFAMGHAHIFKYFLNSWQGIIDVDAICDEILQNCKELSSSSRRSSNYLYNKQAEMILMLLSEIKETEIIDKNCGILLEMMYCSWPHQDIFLKMLYNVKIDSKEKWVDIFDGITENDLCCYYRKCPLEKTGILEKVLSCCGTEVKCSWDIICCLASVYAYTFKISTLKMLLNFSPFLTVQAISRVIYYWTRRKQHNSVKKLLEKLGNERELLTESIRNHVIDKLLENQKFTELDELYDSLGKFGMKVRKNDIDITKYITCCDLDRLEEILKWFHGRQFDVKSYLRNEEISRACIFNTFYDGTGYDAVQISKFLDYIFGTGYDAVQISKFLDYIFGTEEKKKHYKLNVLLKDESSILQFALSCDKEGIFPVDQLLRFCEFTPEKTQELKRKCLSALEFLMESLASKCRNFQVLNSLINWLFASTEEKDKIIKEFMESDMATVLCNKMIRLRKPFYDEQKQATLEFFNVWVKSSKKIPEIRRQLLIMNSEEFTEADKAKLSAMFSKLENGENLVFSDVFSFLPAEKDEFECNWKDLEKEFRYLEYTGVRRCGTPIFERLRKPRWIKKKLFYHSCMECK